MKLPDQIRSRFYKTPLFKGLLGNNFIPKEEAEKQVKVVEERAQVAIKESVEKFQKETLPIVIAEEIQKAETLKRNDAMRMRIPMNWNNNANPDWRIASTVPFSVLRQMAVIYPIARACINRRKSQVVQLEWEISTIDEVEGEKGFEAQIQQVKQFFKQPMGHKTRMREMLNIMVDDILTLDATSFEYKRTRGGEMLYLIPVDPTTIILRLTEEGATPEPPEVAYAQYIAGTKIADFTTEEMLYEIMFARSNTPYGLAPMESLILQVESALRGTLYNLAYFKESNVPEGFITLPADVASTKDLVEQWQDWFDLLMAGSPQFQRRLKILPEGSEYTPAKKPEDMAFERFEMWLLQQTCAVFDVPPQDIGVTYQVNKATAESQSDLAKERGLFPLAFFLKEIFDDIIQKELGFEKLQFMWRNLNPVDRKEEAEIAEKEIKMGAKSVDEYRIEQGREPIGLGHYVDTGKGPILVDDIINHNTPADRQAAQNEVSEGQDDEIKEDAEKMEQKDLKAWRKAIYRDLELGRFLRTKFPSKYISKETHQHISEVLEHVKSKFQAKILFDQYLDPEIKASMKLLKAASEMRKIEDADITPN